MSNVAIFGATSAIAQETARLFASENATICLVARNNEKLDAVASDLKIRGSKNVHCISIDLSVIENHVRLIQEVESQLGRIDTVLIAHGVLPDQRKAEKSYEETHRTFTTNMLSYISLLTIIANKMEAQGLGHIIVISSVAGDRGRQSNYIYGTSKAAINVFTEGLRNRLFKTGVHVMTVKPGFVDSPMTSEFKKGLLWVTPKYVAEKIYAASKAQKDILYTPFFWRYIMMLLKLIPEGLFKRGSL
jgi:decaprenylphospho-beta-D-erythro-pentofuranosid-2-ulose 2-reductase